MSYNKMKWPGVAIYVLTAGAAGFSLPKKQATIESSTNRAVPLFVATLPDCILLMAVVYLRPE